MDNNTRTFLIHSIPGLTSANGIDNTRMLNGIDNLIIINELETNHTYVHALIISLPRSSWKWNEIGLHSYYTQIQTVNRRGNSCAIYTTFTNDCICQETFTHISRIFKVRKTYYVFTVYGLNVHVLPFALNTLILWILPLIKWITSAEFEFKVDRFIFHTIYDAKKV